MCLISHTVTGSLHVLNFASTKPEGMLWLEFKPLRGALFLPVNSFQLCFGLWSCLLNHPPLLWNNQLCPRHTFSWRYPHDHHIPPWCRSGPLQHPTQGQMTEVPSWASEHTVSSISHGYKGQDSSFSPFFPLSSPSAGLRGCLHKSNKLWAAIITLRNEIHPIYQRRLHFTYIIGIIYYELTLEIILLCYLSHFHSLFIAWHQQTAQRKPNVDELHVDGSASHTAPLGTQQAAPSAPTAAAHGSQLRWNCHVRPQRKLYNSFNWIYQHRVFEWHKLIWATTMNM